MATPSEGPHGLAEVERRLHPLSWLFVLLQQLKAYAVPLVVLLFTGRGNLDFFGLYAVAILVLIAVARYFTYWFRLDAHGVTIRSGFFQTTLREIPYERIHNVSTHQSLLHRLCGVAELRLESAGGSRAEAEMRVLALRDAQALEALIRQRGRKTAAVAEGAALPGPGGARERAEVLLALDTAEVVRLGLISNRGLVVVAAVLGTLTQVVPDRFDMWTRASRDAFAWAERPAPELLPSWIMGPAGWAFSAVVLVTAVLIGVRALSVLLALVQFHGFTLVEVGRQLRIERGLLTRVRTHVPRRRIQAWRVTESLLHRWFDRQSLRVDSAAAVGGDDQRAARDLAPLATPAAVQALVRRVLARDEWPPSAWRPLHRHAWRRLIVGPSTLVVAATVVLTWRFGAAGLLAAVAIVPIVARARLWASHAGYAESESLVAVRTGWLTRRWAFAEVRKLQALAMTMSPFDRRHGMATLWLDTAGVSSRDGTLRIRFMPADEARSLYERLAEGMTRTNEGYDGNDRDEGDDGDVERAGAGSLL
jgi:putative membrane protein